MEEWKSESTLSLLRFELPNCSQPAVSRSSLPYCFLTTAPPRLWCELLQKELMEL
ncbi:hypothetical protein L345_09158, partial [Ophiophagus hannah]